MQIFIVFLNNKGAEAQTCTHTRVHMYVCMYIRMYICFSSLQMVHTKYSLLTSD